MIYKKSTIDRIAYTVFLLHAITTYSNVHYGKGLDASISLFICLGVIGVLNCIYDVAYETLTGEPMNILVTFLELLSKKRKARLVKVPVATAIPVQVLALPAPDIQEIDVQEPVLDAIVIEEIKEGVKEDTHVEPEITTEVEAIEVQEEIHEQVSFSPSVNSETTAKPKASDSGYPKEKGKEQGSGKRTMLIPEPPRPAMFRDEYKVNGKSIPISIPEDIYNTIKTEAETLCKEAESTAEAITQTAALLFLGYIDMAVSLAGINGGSAVPPTTGGGGSGSGSGWGKKPKEDEHEWALRCARQVAAMCKPTPRRRFRR